MAWCSDWGGRFDNNGARLDRRLDRAVVLPGAGLWDRRISARLFDVEEQQAVGWFRFSVRGDERGFGPDEAVRIWFYHKKHRRHKRGFGKSDVREHVPPMFG